MTEKPSSSSRLTVSENRLLFTKTPPLKTTVSIPSLSRKSLPTKQNGQWVRLLFDVDAQANLSGSFDDVRITYAGQ